MKVDRQRRSRRGPRGGTTVAALLESLGFPEKGHRGVAIELVGAATIGMGGPRSLDGARGWEVVTAVQGG